MLIYIFLAAAVYGLVKSRKGDKVAANNAYAVCGVLFAIWIVLVFISEIK